MFASRTTQGRIPLTGEKSLSSALGSADASVDAAGCAQVFESIGVHSQQLSDAVFKAYDASGSGKVETRSILCGISLLCASKATAQQKLAFTFQIFDTDRNEQLERAEIERFFEILRGPIATIINGSLQCVQLKR